MNSSNCWLGDEILYDSLSNKEQESYNSVHLMKEMSRWGYLESTKINGDKHGADLLFYRAKDADVKKIQLKGRATFDKKYKGKNLYIAFQDKRKNSWYVYPHDVVVQQSLYLSTWAQSQSWEEKGSYSWNSVPQWLAEILEQWKITND